MAKEPNLCEQTTIEQTIFKISSKSHIFVSRPKMSKPHWNIIKEPNFGEKTTNEQTLWNSWQPSQIYVIRPLMSKPYLKFHTRAKFWWVPQIWVDPIKRNQITNEQTLFKYVKRNQILVSRLLMKSPFVIHGKGDKFMWADHYRISRYRNRSVIRTGLQ